MTQRLPTLMLNDFSLSSGSLTPGGTVSTLSTNYCVEVLIRRVISIDREAQIPTKTEQHIIRIEWPTLQPAVDSYSKIASLVCRGEEVGDVVWAQKETNTSTLFNSIEWVKTTTGYLGYVEGIKGLFKVKTKRIPLIVETLPSYRKDLHQNENTASGGSKPGEFCRESQAAPKVPS